MNSQRSIGGGSAAASREEGDLIRRICAGDRELFQELIRPYERGVYVVAYSVLRSTADAEEVAQESMLKAFLNLSQLRDHHRFKAWLMKVALNEAHMRRRNYRQHLYEPIEVDDGDDARSFRPKSFADWRDLPSEKLDREELRKAVREAVEKLPEKYRVIYILADAQSLDYEEIAATLEISMAAVKTRVHRARMKLQEHLTPAFRPSMSDHLRLMKGMNPWSRVRK